jgi:curli biogenesis system outer membrane secretion channel CsgG
MKKIISFFILAVGFLHGAYTQSAGPGESLIIVSKRGGVASSITTAFKMVDLYIDGQKKTIISSDNQKTRIAVPNGEHSIYTARGSAKSNTVAFAANSSEIEFLIETTPLTMKISKINEKALEIASPPQTGRNRNNTRTTSGDIEGALNRAADELIYALEDDVTIAILSISSRDRETGEFVLEELAYILVDTGRYKVVDRRSLDVIRKEQDFQMTGDVDDGSAVSIGKILGANIVITGSISGSDSTRRLRLKALNVQTAEILAMASERF